MTKERKATHYGQIELIPGVVCDGYVLDDNTTVVSAQGTADLLGMDHKKLRDVAMNWPPEELKLFVEDSSPVAGCLVKVTAKNSPFRGKKIIVYTTQEIQTLISSYAVAFTQDALEQELNPVGERCLILLRSLINKTLNAVISQSH